MNPYTALGQYQSVNTEGRMATSQNHGLVSMLLDRILEKIAHAAGAIDRGDVRCRRDREGRQARRAEIPHARQLGSRQQGVGRFGCCR